MQGRKLGLDARGGASKWVTLGSQAGEPDLSHWPAVLMLTPWPMSGYQHESGVGKK